MPYIKRTIRDKFEIGLNELFNNEHAFDNAGNINYLLTQIMANFIGYPMNYDKLNAAIGILECCKLELYRRLSSYEDEKMRQNGDTSIQYCLSTNET
jgi:hypothetical protein